MKTELQEKTEDLEGEAVSFREAVKIWMKVGLQSFGGPAGQIAVMHKILVEDTRWISEKRFLHALNYCMLLPGPEAQQLATYLGWLLHGYAGGLVAGLLFILPGFLSILGLSLVYVVYQKTFFVGAVFFGLKAAVLALVLSALLRLGKKVLKEPWRLGLAVAAWVGIFFFALPFPLIIVLAGIVGFGMGLRDPKASSSDGGHGGSTSSKVESSEAAEPTKAALLDRWLESGRLAHTQPSLKKAARVLVISLLVWLGPLALVGVAFGWRSTLFQESVFFSQMALVTFGGAYAVLSYMAQAAVGTYGWLKPGEMLDGLGMAETTPGPLIQVVQFVGFMGAYRFSDGLPPLQAALLGSVVATWATFAPCFLFVFVGGPYVEALRNKPSLQSALSGITAAVVGVIFNLALWFGLHTIFAQVQRHSWGPIQLWWPQASSFQAPSFGLFLLATFVLLRRGWSIFATLGLCAAGGLLLKAFVN